MSKSAILRKALEYVRYLQQMNAKLQKENISLKLNAQKLAANGLVAAPNVYVTFLISIYVILTFAIVTILYFYFSPLQGLQQSSDQHRRYNTSAISRASIRRLTY